MNEQEPGLGIGARLAQAWAYVRSRPNFVVFAIGVALFFGGLVSVIGSQLRPPPPSQLVAVNSPSPPARSGTVGPTLGEAVGPYIADRKSVTSDRAAKAPRESTFGIVVFNSYRKASEVEALMKARGLEVVSIATRIQVAGFAPRVIDLNGRTLVEAALSEKEAIAEDLAVLEKVAADATDSKFRTVYEHDLQLQRDALAQLGDDPATVYAAVVTGTNQAMGRTASSAQVRYVDLPEDPTDDPADTTFTALLPEDTQTSSVGPAPENSPEPG